MVESILDFTPLRSSAIYKDALALGWKEVTPRQGELQGNLRFAHPSFQYTIRLNLNGRIWQDEPREEGSNRDKDAIQMDPNMDLPIIKPKSNRDGKAVEILIEANQDPKWFGQCFSIADYETRVQFLIKKLLFQDKWITKEEMLSGESPNEIILRKIDENVDNIKTLKVLPPSLKDDIGFVQDAEKFGLF